MFIEMYHDKIWNHKIWNHKIWNHKIDYLIPLRPFWTLDAANSAAARCAAAYPYPADECSAVAPKLGLEIVACCAGEFIYRYILNELC